MDAGRTEAAPTVIGGAHGIPLPPAGIILGVGMVLWGIERFLDEHLWLGEDGHLGSVLVQAAGIALALAGVALLVTRIGPLQRWRRGEFDGAERLPAAEPAEKTDLELEGEPLVADHADALDEEAVVREDPRRLFARVLAGRKEPAG